MVRPMFELIDLHDLIIQNTKVQSINRMWVGYNAIRRLDHQSSETPEDCYIAAAVMDFLWMGSCIQDAKATKRKGNTSWSLRLWKWKRFESEEHCQLRNPLEPEPKLTVQPFWVQGSNGVLTNSVDICFNTGTPTQWLLKCLGITGKQKRHTKTWQKSMNNWSSAERTWGTEKDGSYGWLQEVREISWPGMKLSRSWHDETIGDALDRNVQQVVRPVCTKIPFFLLLFFAKL